MQKPRKLASLENVRNVSMTLCPRPIGPTYALGPLTLEKEKKKWYGFLIIENYDFNGYI
jgi:hypothetical protein